MEIFPVAMFPPSSWRWDIAGTPLTGGQPVSGVPQTADAAGGGWWVCEFNVARLSSVVEHKAWRAVMARLRAAVGKMAVPIIDACQPWPGAPGLGAGRMIQLGLQDGAGIFLSDVIEAEFAANAYAPAWPAPAAPPTQAQIHMITGAVIEAGMFFSVYGDSGMSRLHLISAVTAVAGDVYTVNVMPPFRENYASGLRIEMDSPMCAMKLDPASVGNVLPAYGPGFVSSPSIRFVEAL